MVNRVGFMDKMVVLTIVEPSDDLHTTSWGFTSREARTHSRDAFELTIKYNDGSQVKKSFNWKLQKNKESL